MERCSFSISKISANKCSRRCDRNRESVASWNDQRVVPKIVNGKTTYIIVSSGSPLHEDGYGFQPSFDDRRHGTSSSYLQHHMLQSSPAHLANYCEADSTTSQCYSNKSGKKHGGDRSLSSSSSIDDTSVMNIVESCEQQMIITDKPSAMLNNIGTGISISTTSCQHTSSTPKPSAVKDQCQHKHRLQVSTKVLDTDTVILSVMFFS